MKKPFRTAVGAALALALLLPLWAQTNQADKSQASRAAATPPPVTLPVTRVVLFSSGVGYFEHSGFVSGDAVASLPFRAEDMNDALKSLVVIDAGTGSPSVSYPSEDPLDRALKGFRVDLSGSPKVVDILAGLRGAEITANIPEPLPGRIVSVETRTDPAKNVAAPWLVLLTKDGVRTIALSDVVSFSFTDKAIAEDFSRALDLILSAADTRRRVLEVNLPGSSTRKTRLGYVIAVPVWKSSYRLDLSGEKPYLQGWAVVDNPTDQDWNGVSLSLVSGRPVSFIQDLYAPLYIDRPVVPLSIAGTAAPRTFDSGFAPKRAMAALAVPSASKMAMNAPSPEADEEVAEEGESAPSASPPAGPALGSGGIEAAVARAAGDQFEFSVRKPVTLERRRSAMIPLVSGDLEAEKVSVFSGTPGAKNPMLCARITNSTGMKLPAGPVTVFDGGTYSGDALLEFLPEKDRRIIAYGDDLSVTADVSLSNAQETTAVTVTKGVMSVTHRIAWTKTYHFRNSSATNRKLIVEHPIRQGAELWEPKSFDEKTDSVYRFALGLPADGEASLSVVERQPVRESITLASLNLESFLRYSASGEIPTEVRNALAKAIDLRKKSDDARKALADLETRKAERADDESRIRDNIDSVGRDSTQGKDYLKKLATVDSEIDAITQKIADARKAVQGAQAAYDSYLGSLTLN